MCGRGLADCLEITLYEPARAERLTIFGWVGLPHTTTEMQAATKRKGIFIVNEITGGCHVPNMYNISDTSKVMNQS